MKPLLENWKDLVFIIPFRSPDKLYFGQKGYTMSIYELDKPILQRITDTVYCGCKKCIKDSVTGKVSCKQTACAECIVKANIQINKNEDQSQSDCRHG